MVKTVIGTFAFLTLLSHLFIVKLAVLYALQKLKLFRGFSFYQKWLGPHVFSLAFLISLVATLGSLFLSEVARFAPCALCWYQRMFMYPQTILLYISIIRNEKFIKPYLVALNLVGAGFALYHHLLLVFPKSFLANCTALAGPSCVKGYSFYFGYISIPLMAMTAFILNIILLSFNKSSNKRG